jgi:hypothetical protein
MICTLLLLLYFHLVPLQAFLAVADNDFSLTCPPPLNVDVDSSDLEVVMETKDNPGLIREYLSVAFPDHPIEYQWDPTSESHHFRVDAPDGHVKHNILLSPKLVDDNPADLIHDHFREHDFRGHLEAAGKGMVVVTNEGISVAEDS